MNNKSTKIEAKVFRDIDLDDEFFTSLKSAYPKFESWFKRKSNEECYVRYNDQSKVVAFLYMKSENEEIELIDRKLASVNRLKIGTFKLSEEIRGTKIGEAFFALIFQHLYQREYKELYVTLFESQKILYDMLLSFGFENQGKKVNEEIVLLRSRHGKDQFKTCFPFIKWTEETKGKYIIVEEEWHDKLFPNATLRNTNQEVEYNAASNGISKVYLSAGIDIDTLYKKGDVLCIYRKALVTPGLKSVVTSLGVCEEVVTIKKQNKEYVTYNEYKQQVGNKSVFTEKDLLEKYKDSKNLYIIKFILNVSFGEGKNINCNTLKNNKLWGATYPTKTILSKEDILKMIKLGGSNVQDIIIN